MGSHDLPWLICIQAEQRVTRRWYTSGVSTGNFTVWVNLPLCEVPGGPCRTVENFEYLQIFFGLFTTGTLGCNSINDYDLCEINLRLAPGWRNWQTHQT